MALAGDLPDLLVDLEVNFGFRPWREKAFRIFFHLLPVSPLDERE